MTLVHLVSRTGINFARRFRKGDMFLRDECKAEALFWLGMFLTYYSDRIMIHPEPLAYIRKTVGKKLLTYIRFNKSSTYFRLKGEGKQMAEMLPIHNEYQLVKDIATDTDIFIVLESVLKSEIDWAIYELKILGHNADVIAQRLEITTPEVKRVLSTIRNRLRINTRIPMQQIRAKKYWTPK